MRFLEIRFRLESPAIIASRRTGRGYLFPLSIIPGTMVRGAIISMLYHSGFMDEKELKVESEESSIIASPAYPCVDNKKAYPCHIFAYKCKVLHGGKSGGSFEKKIYVAEVVKDLKTGLEPKPKSACSWGHVALELIHPKPVLPEGDDFNEATLIHEHVICVGMNRQRATVQRQLLYEYEAIAAGQEFWFRLGLPERFADALKSGVRFYIGRGISRGFGQARLIEIKENFMNDLSEIIRQTCGSERTIILYSLSSVISINGCNYSSYPREIDLMKIANRAGLNASGKLVIQGAYGRTSPLYLGWDMMRNAKRPILDHSLAPGSILVSKIVDGNGWEEGLAALSYIGSTELLQSRLGDTLPVVGVNVLEPLEINPMRGELE